MMWKIIKNIVPIVLFGLLCTSAIANEMTIGQKNKSFVNESGVKVDKVVVKAGDKIHFQNQDPWFHNVFSLSDIKTFDLGSYPKGESKDVLFDTKGEVEVECAIHPQMYMVVKVK